MDEEDCDYGTPIGKVIKQINYLCKKPLLDNQLSEAISLFHEKLNNQEKYLANGIFRLNFAESALFLQSCTGLYGKKVDLLWNELLEFHTRLIRYDCEHRKEKGIPINKEVVSKLEERRNRHLRKKNFKLLKEEEVEVSVVNPPKRKICWDYLIDEDGKFPEIGNLFLSQSREESQSFQMWNDIVLETQKLLKIPYAVHRQMTRTYRLKNNHVLKSEDFDIVDMEDGEFNTKYSRVPGWNHVFHLIEYNNEGLLPDNNHAIGKLKFTMEVRLEFFNNRNLPLGGPLGQYRKEFKKYRKQFLKNEAKKWQNMPLNTFEDFRRQLRVLTHMYAKKEHMARCYFKYIGQNGKDDKIEILDTSDEDSLFELTLACGNEFMKSDLFVRLEKLSSDFINTKLRLDSGYFGYNSDSDTDDDETIEEEVENLAEDTNTLRNATDIDVNKDEDVNDANASRNVDVNSNYTGDVNSDEAADKEDENNCDARSVVSDHDYCDTPPVCDESTRCNSDFVKNNGAFDKATEKIFKRPLGGAKVIPKIDKNESKRKYQINKEQESGRSPAKRRKLSQKQLETLLKSKITPVKLLKFEKFFSENYQSEEGEGEVPSIEYEDEDSNTQTADFDLPGGSNNCDDYEDVRSIHSDHSYCQPLVRNLPDDSGFIEASLRSLLNRQTRDQLNAEVEEEYKRLFSALGKNPDLRDFPEISLPSPYVPLTSGDKEKDALQTRVQEWRNMINPILRNLKEHDFDIHEYGSQMIDGMKINECKPFSNIVQGKTSAEVVRYFISSLQLANTNNIEICGAKRGELSNDTYNIKLLSKDRFHEHLGEYMAPSEETLAEKLERVRAINAQQDSLDPPKTKQVKLKDKKCKAKRLPHITTKDKLMTKPNMGHSRKEPAEATHGTCQGNKENHRTIIPLLPDNTEKGKATVRRRANVPHVLNFDISVPSTSRHVHSLSPEFDGQVPSTSSQMFTPPRDLDSSEEDETHSSRGPVKFSNKRRRNESTEETFLEQLATTQRMNPEIQVHSTPHGATPPKHMRISSCPKKSILF